MPKTQSGYVKPMSKRDREVVPVAKKMLSSMKAKTAANKMNSKTVKMKKGK